MTLFGAEPSPEPGRPRAPQWTQCAGGRCDQCVSLAIEANRRGDTVLPRVMAARWRRVHHDTDLRLCYEHARPAREADDETRK